MTLGTDGFCQDFCLKDIDFRTGEMTHQVKQYLDSEDPCKAARLCGDPPVIPALESGDRDPQSKWPSTELSEGS